MLPDVLRVIKKVTEALDQKGISYLIGGSVASSTLGKYRFTNDIDFVVDLSSESVSGLSAALGSEFYMDADLALEAVLHRSSFSILHLDTMVKADLFIRPVNAWSDMAWNRRKVQTLKNSEQLVDVYVRSAEDMILQKLHWYKLGREVSDRQWGDVVGMLEVQADVLDYSYLETWATTINVDELLHRAFAEAGIGKT